jgi:site-specific recombinase XerD
LENEKIIASSPTKNIPMPKVISKEPNYLSEQELDKLLKAVQKDKSIYRKRNEIIVRTLAETGIRLNELTNIDIGNIDTKEKTIRILRKGNIEQTLPINMKLNILLRNFIKDKKADEPLLVSNHNQRITNRRVGLMIQRYLKKAKIEKPNISCHSIRHSFCVRLLEQGVDIKTIQVLAGHKSIETTSGYLHIAQTRLRKEVAKVEI